MGIWYGRMPNKYKIIMLAGKSGAGKDYFYQQYKENNPDKIVKRFAFADKIKSVIEDVTGWNRHSDDKEGKIRTILQRFGMLMRDEYDTNTWADITANDIKKCIDSDNYPCNKEVVIMITDVRFDSEIFRIKEAFPDITTEVYKLHRDFKSRLTKEQQKDPSEHGVSDYLVNKNLYF